MKIVYPYNEVLPLKRAHDAFVVRNCASLAQEGADVTLLCGKGSWTREELFEFYKIDANNPLKIVQLPILRRNNPLNINWNFLFFYCTRKYISQHLPDVVICSVLKQADFLLKRKIRNCQYVYEVHQLQWYPSMGSHLNLEKVRWERTILNRFDLVTTTTQALKEILSLYPYDIQTSIEISSLACDFKPLAPKKLSQPLKLYYIGQLYAKQGLHHLLDALKNVEGIELYVVGGRTLQIEHYKKYCEQNEMSKMVHFLGFVSPDQFCGELKNADAFITTFENTERMPYVAHTKIYEYISMQKPVIAPDLDIVHEHAPFGILTYSVNDLESLKEALNKIQDPQVYYQLADEIKQNKVDSWMQRAKKYRNLLQSKISFSKHLQKESV